MHNCIEFQILHLEDEPQNVCFMPRVLYQHLRDSHIGAGGAASDVSYRESDDEQDFNIVISAKAAKFDLRYRILTTEDEFKNAIAGVDFKYCAIVLDAQIGSNNNAGLLVFREITKHSPCGPVFILTAFPEEVCKQLGWARSDERLLIKGASRTQATERLVQAIEGWWREIID